MTNLDCINALINCFTRLPGVGYKTAERYAYKIVETDAAEVEDFCRALKCVKANVKFCRTCGNFTDSDAECKICAQRKQSGIVCVVRDPRDAIAIEKSGAFGGTYHILHGVISPLDKKGPDDINLKSLMLRVRPSDPNENSSFAIKEVIIATSPTVEGEATANYIAALIKPLGIRVTRLAQGLALGTNLEYADEVTLGAAINNRTAI